MSILSSLSMFYLSFAPLWLSILFIDAKSIYEGGSNLVTEKYSILAIMIIGIVSLFILMLSFDKKGRDGVQSYSIQTVEEEKTVTTEYLLSYILPLFAFDFTHWDQVVLFLVFYSILAFLCVRHNHFSVNVLLELMKYRFYRCTLKNEDNVIISKTIISKERLTNRRYEDISIRSINNEYSSDLTNWKEKCTR